MTGEKPLSSNNSIENLEQKLKKLSTLDSTNDKEEYLTILNEIISFATSRISEVLCSCEHEQEILIKKYQEELKKDPQNPNALFRLIDTISEQKKISDSKHASLSEKQESYYKNLIDLYKKQPPKEDDEHLMILDKICSSAIKLNKIEESHIYLAKIFTISHDTKGFDEIVYNKGAVYKEIGDKESAIQCYKAVLNSSNEKNRAWLVPGAEKSLATLEA